MIRRILLALLLVVGFVGSAFGQDFLTRGAANTTYSQVFAPARGGKVVFLGDSRTIRNASTGSVQRAGSGWVPYLNALFGGRIRPERNSGVSGDTLLGMRNRLASDVAVYNPDIVVFFGDVNSVNAQVPLVTIKSQIEDIILNIKAIGALPVVLYGMPYDNSGTGSDGYTRRETLLRLQQWYAKRLPELGVVGIDLRPLLADPTTVNGWKSGYSDDGLHPNRTSDPLIAAAIYAALDKYVPASPIIAPSSILPSASSGASVSDPLNLVAYAGSHFVFDTNSDGLGNTFTKSGTVATSLVTDANIVGNWQRLTASPGAGSPSISCSVSTPPVGSKILFICRVRTRGLNNGWNVNVGVNVTSTGAFADAISDWRHNIGDDVDGGRIISCVYTVGSTHTRANPSIRFEEVGTASGNGEIDIAQVTMYNLTALQALMLGQTPTGPIVVNYAFGI